MCVNGDGSKGDFNVKVEGDEMSHMEQLDRHTIQILRGFAFLFIFFFLKEIEENGDSRRTRI